MSLTIEQVRTDIEPLGKNVQKIRKYIRDHQSQLQGLTTNQLNKQLKDLLPHEMSFKRNYGNLSLRQVGKLPAEPKKEKLKEVVQDDSLSEEEPVEKKHKKRPKQLIDDEDEEQDVQEATERLERQPQERPAQEVSCFSASHYLNSMTNNDLVRACFQPVSVQRYAPNITKWIFIFLHIRNINTIHRSTNKTLMS